MAPVAFRGPRSSGFRSARTSGTTPTSGRAASTAAIRSRRWCGRAPRSSSTSRRRRTRCEKRHLRPRMLGGDGARAGSGRCCSSTRSAARTIWCSTAPAWRSTRAGEVIARGAEHDDRSGDRRRRPRDGARSRRSSASDERSALAALALGTRDYARRCGFSQRAARAVGRHRLGAGRVHRRARARSRATCSASRCRRATRRRARSPTRRRSPRALGIDFSVDPDRADVRRLPRDAGGAARALRAGRRARGRGRRRRSDRPEPAGARPRRDPDGALATGRIACCSPPATRARSPPATARCTATWRAGWR